MPQSGYGEVGVLTDNDISNYIKTIPNLSSTKDVNKALLAMTLDSLSIWYKKRLSTVAWLWYDVSWLAGAYDSIKSQADNIRSSLWIKTTTATQTAPAKPTAKNFNSLGNVNLWYNNTVISFLWPIK